MAERPSTSLLNDGQTRHLLAVMSLAAAIARDLAGTPARRGDGEAVPVPELHLKEAI
jgi:hypothetical protein